MRLSVFPAVLLLSVGLLAQPLPPLQKAQLEIGRIRELVEAGALPRVRLEQAERALAEAKDDEILNHTLYGKVSIEEMTKEQADAMIAAAQRKLERQEARVENTKKLVGEGVMAPSEMAVFTEDLETRRRTLDLALSRAKLLEELANMARVEVAHMDSDPQLPAERGIMERYDAHTSFGDRDFVTVSEAFEKRFSKPLPVSARGETALHRALGFDHRGRVDVALNPDQAEGVWLRKFLMAKHMSYFAFRSAIPGQATAPHIHLGPPSTRLQIAD